MSRTRVLVLAEMANPEWVSGPLVAWSHYRALARRVDAHLVTQVRNRDAIQRAGLPEESFTAIDSERLAAGLWRLAARLRGGEGRGWTTLRAVGVFSYYYFEHLVWRQFGERIARGEFELVHRLSPITPSWPSPIAGRCAAAGVPFVLGPLNGGLPWPRGFDAERRREREWLSYVRAAYRLLPGYAATREHARAILVASRTTWNEVPERWRGKCVYIPENAVDGAVFGARPRRSPGRPLRVAFVGRLVPLKGVDMLIEAAAPLIAEGRLRLDLLGDGPEMDALRGLVERLGLGAGVEFAGWLDHAAVRERLARADLLGFPSIREFGGAVVLEAMALGVVPIVVDYGGPGELVTGDTGCLVPLGTRPEIVAAFRKTLARFAERPEEIVPLAERARTRVLRAFTWEAKARQVCEVYDWVLGRAEKPDFGMPLRTPPQPEAGAREAVC